MRPLRPIKNRKLRQRRPLRWPTWGALWSRLASALRCVAKPALVVCGLASAFALAALAYAWVMSSPRFLVREVLVTGNARVTREEILALAALPLRTNVFSLSLSTLRDQILEIPWIERAEVTRRLPDRIAIAVKEREPAGVVILGRAYLVDRSGRPFKRAQVEKGEAASLVAITGLDRQRFAADTEAGARAVGQALALVEKWQRREERPPVGEVHVRRGGYTLYTLEGAVAVRLGSADADVERRLERFDVVWAALSPSERALAKTIHLDSRARPDRVTVRLADAL